MSLIVALHCVHLNALSLIVALLCDCLNALLLIAVLVCVHLDALSPIVVVRDQFVVLLLFLFRLVLSVVLYFVLFEFRFVFGLLVL